jgi:2,4-dienoyl-CoA reductase-like NADH-dependent reductase (Old Yellow Enzyme family)
MHNHLVHGANGYLVTQFLDNTANHRTDQWGGSAENRSRFGLEVLKAVKEVFGRNVSIKLSPAGGYNDVGYVTVILFRLVLIHCAYSMPLPDTIETYKYFITEAEKLDLAYIVLLRYSTTVTNVEIDGRCLSLIPFPPKQVLIYLYSSKGNYEEPSMTS